MSVASHVWVDGRVVPVGEARVSVLDHGFTVGDGVFETLKVTHGVPFALRRHLLRLRRSADVLGLSLPDDADVRRAVDALLSVVGPELGALGRLRITATAGAGPLGSGRSAAPATLVVAAAPAVPWPPTEAVVTVPFTRNPGSAVAGAKTTSYAENVVALARARSAGAGEALLADTQGRLSEGTGSNVFVVVEGRLLTPSLSTGCLPGITRELVLEWVGAEEAELPMEVLLRADEVFLTSSTRDVHPVHAVDGRRFDAPGPVTAQVREVVASRSAETVDP